MDHVINGKSLLSLSIAAANANPVPTRSTPEAELKCGPENEMQQDSGVPPWSANSLPSVDASYGPNSMKSLSQLHKHRRMSSLGQLRRRTSDARDAATRPTPAAVHTAASTLASLATPPLHPSKSNNLSGKNGQLGLMKTDADARLETMGVGAGLLKDEKKAAIFKCETCSKVYRHPSCLVKHRWEHSPHWRETSKFLLSKHQQVQLLEAAAILSHLAPSVRGGASLPEDRALWPAYLSGGKLYPTTDSRTAPTIVTPSADRLHSAMSNSLPMSPRPLYSSPRVHKYAITSTSGIERVQPDVFGICRSDLNDAINRTKSSPIDLRTDNNDPSIPFRSDSEGREHPWDLHSPPNVSRSPSTEDDSDFEMNESTLNRDFDRTEGRKPPEWDGLEMEMEM